MRNFATGLAYSLFMLAGLTVQAQEPASGIPVKDSDTIRQIPGVTESLLIRAADAESDGVIRLPEAKARFAVNGAGLCVAVLDTGIRETHDAFSGRVVPTQNYTSERGTDRDGHGTHVAGIIVSGIEPEGVAPQARVVSIKVIGASDGAINPVEAGLQWVLENRALVGITAVNMSLSFGNQNLQQAPNSETFMRIGALIDRLTAERIPVVIAAGNYYACHSLAGSANEGMTFPAIWPAAISVGAVFDATGMASCANPIPMPPRRWSCGAEAKSTRSGQITPFSQRLLRDDGIGTDIFAPGSVITSAGIESDQSVSRDMNGTSQACPVTTGVILLMQELHRRLRGRDPEVQDLVRWLRAGPRGIDEDPMGAECSWDNVINTNKPYFLLDALDALSAMERELTAPEQPVVASTPEPAGFSATLDPSVIEKRQKIDEYVLALANPEANQEFLKSAELEVRAWTHELDDKLGNQIHQIQEKRDRLKDLGKELRLQLRDR